MSRNIDNSENILDSRDVIARRDELQEERDALETAVSDAEDELNAEEDEERRDDLHLVLEDRQKELNDWTQDYGAELRALDAFIDEGDSGWSHGETLIREDYFEAHARELAGDLHGRAVDDAAWPFSCIDWKQAADELMQDYTGADFDGVTYYYRG